LWDTAAARLTPEGDEPLRNDLARLRAALRVDGELLDCDRAMPFRLCHHVWKTVYDAKARKFGQDAGGLMVKLADILHMDFIRSAEGVSAERLKVTVGEPHQDLFDFEALSGVLIGTALPPSLPESRRRRINWLLSVLETQRFFPALIGGGGNREPYSFRFENCADAVAAFHERRPQMIELSKAITMARLEANGAYNESRHDPFFANYGADGATPAEFALFPDYLIHARAAEMHAADIDNLQQAFASGLRAKVVAQTDDLLELLPNTCAKPP
jgi:hypothetical protein